MVPRNRHLLDAVCLGVKVLFPDIFAGHRQAPKTLQSKEEYYTSQTKHIAHLGQQSITHQVRIVHIDSSWEVLSEALVTPQTSY